MREPASGGAVAQGARFALAFDTANEVIAIGVGRLVPGAVPAVEAVASVEVEARRASNTQLLPRIDALLTDCGVGRGDIACVVCGRGPGSFTGVRIAMATAKGIASALGVGLVGVSSLDAVAWGAWRGGARGRMLVVADAMRKEVYPVRFHVADGGVERLEADRVEKADAAAARLCAEGGPTLAVAGDALRKYAELFSPCGAFLPETAWTPTGEGLLLALQAAWRAGAADPLDARRHHPALALPVYTRLSDAEENERARLAKSEPKNLVAGVQDVPPHGVAAAGGGESASGAVSGGVPLPVVGADAAAAAAAAATERASMHATARLAAPADVWGVVYRPLDAAHVSAVAALEREVMGSDAWNEALVADELARPDRVWWMALGSAVLPDGGPADAAAFRGTRPGRADGGLRTEVRGASAITSAAGTTEALADSLRQPATGGQLAAGGQPAAEGRLAAEGQPATSQPAACGRPAGSADMQLLGYAGGWVVDGEVQVLKVGVASEARRRGIARELLARVAADARDLGASACSLEVRAGNAGAQAFYRALGLAEVGVRPRYYSDREDAVIMRGPLPVAVRDVAGMALQVDAARAESLLARESVRIGTKCAVPAEPASPSLPTWGKSPDHGFLLPASYGENVENRAICATPDDTVPEGTVPDGATPDAVIPDGATPDAIIPDGATPDATAPRAAATLRAAVPHAVAAPHAAAPCDVAPRAVARQDASCPPAASAPLAAARPLILAIESSCDETAAAIVDGAGNLVADVVASQIDFHARFGGVVPEIASRKHIEAICGVCDECLDVAAAHLGVPGLTWRDLDAVAVTYAPGLVGALVVGVAFAKGAAWAAGLPFIGVNHLEGHLYANRIGAPDFAPPAVVSLVSGGNTLLVHMKDWGDYETLGATIDDAVGEAFDKVAKALGLGYPGGPVVSREAAKGDAGAIAFPRAMLHSGDLRFSLSGLKTAVVTYINNERAAGREPDVPNVCASFQQAVVDVQVAKARAALEQTGAPTFCLGGGVAANPVLRAAYERLCAEMGVRLVLPPLSACGDNAGMIALVALDRYRQGAFFGLDADAQAHANLDEPY